ncbi:unnamed protein product, partial [Pleuronectes platessa]
HSSLQLSQDTPHSLHTNTYYSLRNLQLQGPVPSHTHPNPKVSPPLPPLVKRDHRAKNRPRGAPSTSGGETGKETWREEERGAYLSAASTRGMEKKGRLRAPGDPQLRQRRYPCLRQEFHFIGNIKTGTGREGARGANDPFFPSMGGGGILEGVAMVTPPAWDL